MMLINMKRIQDADVLLQKFFMLMNSLQDKNGLIWYYAMCMDMLLDTCYTIRSYEECNQFYLSEISNFQGERLSEAKSRFFANLSLYCARHELYEVSQTWMDRMSICLFLETKSSINNAFTGLRVIEGLTLQLVFAIEGRSVTLSKHYNAQLEKMTFKISLSLKVSNIFIERLELYRIYISIIRKLETVKLKKLERLTELAVKSQDYNSSDLIKHTLQFWRSELPPTAQHFWIKHSTTDYALNLNQISCNDRIFPFSLPIPTAGNY